MNVFISINKDIRKEIKEYGSFLDCEKYRDCEFSNKKKGESKYDKY